MDISQEIGDSLTIRNSAQLRYSDLGRPASPTSPSSGQTTTGSYIYYRKLLACHSGAALGGMEENASPA